ncbi:hypothetical protein AHAS_Ahas17G0056300 [Arachis hypogaea]
MMRCFTLLLLLLYTSSSTCSSVLPLCNHHDYSNLLQFKNSFAIDISLIGDSKTASWKNGTDCCEWDGVTCDTTSGHVIGLDLSCSMLEGEFHPNSTLFQLTHLQQLNLAFNDFSHSPIYPGIGNLVSLTHLNLSYSSFERHIPSTISHLSKLLSLDLSCTYELRLDESTWSKLIGNTTNLEQLVLHGVDMSSIRDTSLSLLMNLSSSLLILSLDDTRLHGKFPTRILGLTNLEELSLSGNLELKGELPKSNWSTPLRILDLSWTPFSEEIPDSISHLKSLNQLRLWKCQFDGLIPVSLWNLTQLTELNLSGNRLHGDFPNLIFEFLKNLAELDMSSNDLSGLVDFSYFSKLESLTYLDLSNNILLSVDSNNSVEYTLPKLENLDLSFCGVTVFPSFLPRLQNLRSLDISNNKIHGKIPNWFGDNLLHTWKIMYFIDLSFNQLQGDLPILPNGINYFSVSNNNFTGGISSTICNASSLNMLILSHNNLTGNIPQCLGSFPWLQVLDFQINNFYGSIPENFCKSNAFETIKLSGNHLEGRVPQSLANCSKLEVLDLDDNNIEDVFPSRLEALQELQVLSLRNNKFHGTIIRLSRKHPFPKLRIFDVSNNKFSGPLPMQYFQEFQGMMTLNDSTPEYMITNGRLSGSYNDSVVIIMKGQKREMSRILTIFTTIDLSNNMFEGEIPHVIGELSSLKGLNLSHNKISGNIPQTLGNLTSLEWLDLSWNQLKGEIPMSLTNLNFLSVLNLSENQLKGVIPTGKQFNTFQNDSYRGNPMLCGFPLSKSCRNDEEQPPSVPEAKESLFGWKSVAVGYGCGMVFGMFLGRLFIKTAKPLWLARLICGYT